jgi:hypothetical protein
MITHIIARDLTPLSTFRFEVGLDLNNFIVSWTEKAPSLFFGFKKVEKTTKLIVLTVTIMVR